MGLKIFCVLILGIFACNKVNQWKQPTEVCFHIELSEDKAINNQLAFHTGYLVMQSFNFDGKRAEGADVYFTKQYKNTLNAPIGEDFIEGLTFDIPQGVYTSIDVEVFSKNNQVPNLVINGTYKDQQGAKHAVRFEFTETVTFEIEGEHAVDKNQDIDLVDNSKAHAAIMMNPSKWFDFLSGLEHASSVDIDGEKTIVISQTHNPDIYQHVIARLGQEKQKAVFVKQN